MEITNEIKAKVFAQYLGQEMFVHIEDSDDITHKTVIGKKPFLGMGVLPFCYWTPSDGAHVMFCSLILKPLLAITDEDALNVSKITGHASHLTNESQIFQARELLKTPNFFVNQTNISGNKWLQITQFLQSKGYDLPHYLLGGKTLFESGLAIYEPRSEATPKRSSSSASGGITTTI